MKLKNTPSLVEMWHYGAHANAEGQLPKDDALMVRYIAYIGTLWMRFNRPGGGKTKVEALRN